MRPGVLSTLFCATTVLFSACQHPGHPASTSPNAATGFVDVHALDPAIRLDLRYATPNNFTHQQVYPVARCLLRNNVAQELEAVEKDLAKEGLGLKLFDCYRPLSVQRKFWALVPDDRYVANPAKGSRHNRGAAVDLTLINLKSGNELPMGTGFDDFTEHAHRDYTNLTAEELANRHKLESAMQQHGFEGLPTEWWHFDAKDWQHYPVEDVPLQ